MGSEIGDRRVKRRLVALMIASDDDMGLIGQMGLQRIIGWRFHDRFGRINLL
jgi:hypothetical protein